MKVKTSILFYIYKNNTGPGFAWIYNVFWGIYTFSFIYPIILVCILSVVGSSKPKIEVICIFDYSLIMYIPVKFTLINIRG